MGVTAPGTGHLAGPARRSCRLILTSNNQPHEVETTARHRTCFQQQCGGSGTATVYHDQLIDLLVAMKFYDLTNDIRFPRTP
jgi:hypothetical protein